MCYAMFTLHILYNLLFHTHHAYQYIHHAYHTPICSELESLWRRARSEPICVSTLITYVYVRDLSLCVCKQVYMFASACKSVVSIVCVRICICTCLLSYSSTMHSCSTYACGASYVIECASLSCVR
jgi:hypothetical protein